MSNCHKFSHNQDSIHPIVRPIQVLNPRVLELLFTLPILRTLLAAALFALRKLSVEGAVRIRGNGSSGIKSGATPLPDWWLLCSDIVETPACVG